MKELIEGLITDAQAEEIADEILADLGRSVPVHEVLGMSRCEWTAYAHGVEFREIANWRVYGWPNQCFVCKNPIIVENYGWLAREHEGRMQLKHVICPESA